MGKLFSYANRPVHLGPYPLERLARAPADRTAVPPRPPVSFAADGRPESLVHAIREYQAMLDVLRDGLVKAETGVIPDDPEERARHLKAFGYYCDASMVGICRIEPGDWLLEPLVNPEVTRLAESLRTRQTKTLASGIDVIMAELRESAEAPATDCRHHTHAIVFLHEHPRAPREDEPGGRWIAGAEEARACLRGAETVAILSNYLRLLGRDARGHTGAASDVELNRLAVAAGLARVEAGQITNPFLGERFGLSAITTTLEMAPDAPLAEDARAGLAWWGTGRQAKSAWNHDPFRRRDFAMGPHPFETLKRVETPTTFIDEPRVARVPKRTDMFARAQFGDMG
ncbi:MAG: NAD-binding oxidoreductase, partial [Pseudomonadota bacterium]